MPVLAPPATLTVPRFRVAAPLLARLYTPAPPVAEIVSGPPLLTRSIASIARRCRPSVPEKRCVPPFSVRVRSPFRVCARNAVPPACVVAKLLEPFSVIDWDVGLVFTRPMAFAACPTVGPAPVVFAIVTSVKVIGAPALITKMPPPAGVLSSTVSAPAPAIAPPCCGDAIWVCACAGSAAAAAISAVEASRVRRALALGGGGHRYFPCSSPSRAGRAKALAQARACAWQFGRDHAKFVCTDADRVADPDPRCPRPSLDLGEGLRCGRQAAQRNKLVRSGRSRGSPIEKIL